ncbi:FecR family protein [Methylomonas sp. SURF-1]|uniref:FecR family protein n=1 Tax=Methylomonas aurea TaxID=2952224 RepID=A0ABT1UFA2_9GAMM|nr:FecR family protein [Methylomonas sp. SURF-1]MCQ8180908.1 FecR family protein [Methylomonas sp. SURF-1]
MTATTPSQRHLKQATTWFVILQSEQVAPEQRENFERWLAASPVHRQAFSEVERVWGNLDELKSGELPELEHARAARPQRWRHGGPLLTGVLLATIVGVGWHEISAPTTIHQTGIGERREIALADGSRLQLNTATRLHARISWLRREIDLEQGEAVFDVAHERWRPFRVHAGKLHISDIGTLFNVRHQDAGGTSVSVLEGEVELRLGRSWLGEVLSAGFGRRLDAEGRWRAPEKIDAEPVLAWTRGQLLFNHTPLTEVIKELERYHNLHFVLADASLGQQTLSGRFDAGDLQPFLQALQSMLPVRVQRGKDTIVLHKR